MLLTVKHKAFRDLKGIHNKFRHDEAVLFVYTDGLQNILLKKWCKLSFAHYFRSWDKERKIRHNLFLFIKNWCIKRRLNANLPSNRMCGLGDISDISHLRWRASNYILLKITCCCMLLSFMIRPQMCKHIQLNFDLMSERYLIGKIPE